MLDFVEVAVGEGEGLGCATCRARLVPSYRPADEVISEIRDVAARWGGRPGPNLVLCGPEPFAHPELPRLVAAAVEAGVERLALETDGGALSVSQNATGALRSGVRHLRVRVLAADAAVSDGLTGKPGLSASARVGIGLFLEAAAQDGVACAVTAIVPVCDHNLVMLPAIVAELAGWGVHAVRLVKACDLPDGAATDIAAACDTGMVNRLWVETDGRVPLPSGHALHEVPEAGSPHE